MDSKATVKQITDVISCLIAAGLCDDQNYPATSQHEGNVMEILPSLGTDVLSIALRDLDYAVVYDTLDKKKAYTAKMLDGALLQFMYRFQDEGLISHRLAFFPPASMSRFQNEPDLYGDDDVYAEVVHKRIVAVPFRFDFDPRGYEAVWHARTHLTLGQYKNCRIPVACPLTPRDFADFVLRHFYNTAFRRMHSTLPQTLASFSPSITAAERSVAHLTWHSP